MEILRADIEEYLHYCAKEKRLSSHTLRAYRIDLDQLLTWLQTTGSTAFSRSQLKRYIVFLNAHFSASSVKRKVAAVRAFANYQCLEKGAVNPFLGARISIREPQMLPQTIPASSLAKILAPEQARPCETALTCFLRHRNQAILELLIATGIRVSELCQLDLESCNLTSKEARIYGKGSKERIVELESETTLQALSTYLKVRERWLARTPRHAASHGRCQAVFLNRFNARLSEQAVRSIIAKRAQAAGVSMRITPHMFRHTFATMLLEDDVNLRYIQNLLGHSSVKTTERYTHVARAKQREIMRKHNPRETLKAFSA